MGATRWSVDRLIADVERLNLRALPRERYFEELAHRLRRVVDADATCWHTLDPSTRLLTSEAPRELLDEGILTEETAPAAGRQVIAAELLGDRINAFAWLAGRRAPVGILSEVTRGRPERSERYRDVLAPAGIPFELRAAFVLRGRAWGAVHLARREERGDFARQDAAVLARLAAPIAEGLRTSLRFDAARRPQDGGAPGLVVLDAADDIVLITAPARELLAAMRSTALARSEHRAPAALLALAQFTRSRARAEEGGPAAVAVPSALGWITLHASLPEGGADGQVAIVVDRATTEQASAVRLEVHGVSAREREVAVLLAQGASNTEIAAALVLSPYTVQDHIKSLFEKTGVASRQELVARVFLDDYLPRITERAGLTAAGTFASGG
jgi:DNA-binding NarL/FixJ family response regulator